MNKNFEIQYSNLMPNVKLKKEIKKLKAEIKRLKKDNIKHNILNKP